MIELFVEKQQVDINEAFSTLISYAIDDIKDFGAKNTAVSKTIILPGTARNNQLFGHIFNVTRATQYQSSLPNYGYNFNAATSAPAIAFSDHIQIFKGVLRLMEIIIDKEKTEYEVVILGELGGFAAALGNYKLIDNLKPDGTPNPSVDLDFSIYDHAYTISNITTSWNNASGGSGYYYPLIDYGTYGRNAALTGVGKHSWKYKTLRPALFVKEYLEKIFAVSGYSYDFPLLSTTRLKSFIVPHNQKTLTGLSTQILAATRSGSTLFINAGTAVDVAVNFTTVIGTTFSTSGGGTRFTYTPAAAGTFNVNASIFGSTIANTSGFTVEIRKNGVLIPGQRYTIPARGNTTSLPFSWSTTVAVPFVTNDYIELFVSSTAIPFNPDELRITTAGLGVNNTVPILVPSNLTDVIQINRTIPKNILQKDFVSSIVKLFNLYVYEDSNKEKHLRIAPFGDFFDSATTEDWSNKLDRSQPIRLKPMSELNSRYYLFKFKPDADFYNDQYKRKFNESYGDRTYDSGFEFAKESETVELIFSPTPLVGYPTEDKVYSTIFKSNNGNEENIDCNIRILQAKKVTGVASWDIVDVDGTTVLATLSDYPYAGHFDDPDAPTNDIHFGVPKELYFVLATGAINNNQFNVYYSDYMAEITDPDSKLMMATFRLTRQDIANLNFAVLKWVDGSLFRLNKINDYNASKEDTCKVELLKVINLSYT